MSHGQIGKLEALRGPEERSGESGGRGRGRLKSEGIGRDAESQRQNRNKLQMENAVTLRQNQVNFGS